MSGLISMTGCIGGALAAGGIGVLASRQRELIRRWRTWLMAAALVIGCLWLGAAGAVLLAALLALVAAVEYARLTGLRRADLAVLIVAVVALPAVAWRDPGDLGRALACGLLAVALMPVLTADVERGSRRAAMGVLGVAWLGSLAGIVMLGGAALPVLFAVAVADVGAWCGGRLLRGPALSPLSPAKRWSGVLGGAVSGGAALAAMAAVSGTPGVLTPAHVVAVAVGAPLGDLLESMVKRGAGAKDAGSWLPGFGGLLDRIDSVLVVLALAVIL
ncbi:MAG: phosphatidate cytidylyltransferase [Actinomycetia bacterium]|nr:phosphatidate cytidylyltransferase [Actinomycetes bacterium]